MHNPLSFGDLLHTHGVNSFLPPMQTKRKPATLSHATLLPLFFVNQCMARSSCTASASLGRLLHVFGTFKHAKLVVGVNLSCVPVHLSLVWFPIDVLVQQLFVFVETSCNATWRRVFDGEAQPDGRLGRSSASKRVPTCVGQVRTCRRSHETNGGSEGREMGGSGAGTWTTWRWRGETWQGCEVRFAKEKRRAPRSILSR